MNEVDSYLAVCSEFKLGGLDTEKRHPLTLKLSDLAKTDLAKAFSVLQEVDLVALRILSEKWHLLTGLAKAMEDTLKARGRVFICGCGATGRLALAIEVLCREGMLPEEYSESVIAFMAGGDAALIKSIERFEDHPEFGARQLEELSFGDGDLLISVTEGGETPFVIGATKCAAVKSKRKPFFLYCNPDDCLIAAAKRSQEIIEDEGIEKINLAVGPMALSGSTRMQASTVLMAAVGVAFMAREDPLAIEAMLDDFVSWISKVNFAVLEPLTRVEAQVYERGEFVFYEPGIYGITVLTDTTERSPTFSLAAFENEHRLNDPTCLCYLRLPKATDSMEAWCSVLHRRPRALEWDGLSSLTGIEQLLGFDFSSKITERRKERTNGEMHHVFSIMNDGDHLTLRLMEQEGTFFVDGKPPLFVHLLLKMLLNAHSTLLMGILGRYEGNLMTYVSPSNNKLIDRAVRYVRFLLEDKEGIDVDYAFVARQIFHDRASLQVNEAIVLKTLDSVIHALGNASIETGVDLS